MFFHSAISTNITWPNEHLSNVNTITFIQEKLSSIMAYRICLQDDYDF